MRRPEAFIALNAKRVMRALRGGLGGELMATGTAPAPRSTHAK
jgi:hypothetical protein